MILPMSELSHLKGFNKQPYLDMHHIWPKDVYFPVFQYSTKKNSTMINFSSLFIQLAFLH